MMSQATPSSTTEPNATAPKKSRRGRRSVIPPEQREHVRRLKKQNMERRRRACIADKMNALHTLAMNLIGEDPTQYQKAEKADLLNMCYSIFEHFVAVVNEQPDIRKRVQRVMDQTRGQLISQYTIAPSSSTDNPSQSSTLYERIPPELESQIVQPEDKENWSSSHWQTPIHQLPQTRQTEPFKDTPMNCSNDSPSQHTPGMWQSELTNAAKTTVKSAKPTNRFPVDSGIDQSIDLSLPHYSIWNMATNVAQSESPCCRPKRNSVFDDRTEWFLNSSSSPSVVNWTPSGGDPGASVLKRSSSAQSTPLWRPYLD